MQAAATTRIVGNVFFSWVLLFDLMSSGGWFACRPRAVESGRLRSWPEAVGRPCRDVAAVARRSEPRFENEVERRLEGAAETGKACLVEDVPEAGLACLGTQHEATAIRNVMGTADRRGRRVVHPGHRRDIVVYAVVGEGLDQHHRAVRRERLRGMSRSGDRIAHVVQCVEEADEIVA